MGPVGAAVTDAGCQAVGPVGAEVTNAGCQAVGPVGAAVTDAGCQAVRPVGEAERPARDADPEPDRRRKRQIVPHNLIVTLV